MAYNGSTIYDREAFLEKYMIRRGCNDSPNNAIEKPIIFELIGDIQHKHILDLGCGDAQFGVELLELGAATYTGIEGSKLMIQAAQENLVASNGTVIHETMETYDFPENTMDLITSRFALHYIVNLNTLFENVYKALSAEGKFVFSVQHPLITSSFISKQTSEKRENWIVDDYFLEGERSESWLNQVVTKFHRTTETYFKMLREAGFIIDDLREGKPAREHFSSEEEFTRRQRIPVVLVFSCTKR